MARLATPFLSARSVSVTGRRLAAVAVLAGTVLLGACGTVPVQQRPTQAPQPAAPAQAPAAPRIEAVKAALLLPLSGPRAELGQQMLNAAQMAVFDVAGEGFELLPRDTKGTPQGAAAAARQALADGARVVLGPVFAAEVQAVRPIAQAAGVEVLAFSSDWTVAGGGAHVLGFVPADQVSRVAGFATSHGIRQVAVAAPRSDFGELSVTALQAAAGRLGAQIVAVERYDPNATDIAPVVQALKSAAPAPQAILIADGADRARQLAAALTGAGIDTRQVKLLGTGLWDVADIGRDPAMIGAWFAAADPARRTTFETKYEQTYGRKPQRVTTLAYDATALAATLARMRGPAGMTHRELVGDAGFEGLDGVFRLRETGIAQRALVVLEVTPTGVRVVDPAPVNFDQPLY